MIPVLMTTMGAAVILGYMAQFEPAIAERTRQVTADVAAINFLSYRSAVISYVAANPSATGTVADSSLTFAMGYVRDSRWTNTINGGSVYVYSTGTLDANTFDAVFRRSGKSLQVGKASASGTFMSARGGDTGVALPGGITTGALVMLGK